MLAVIHEQDEVFGRTGGELDPRAKISTFRNGAPLSDVS
jgi:hypothetical protein